MSHDELRAMITGPLMELARAREYAVGTVDIPAPRPLTDFCPSCGGSARDWPMRVTPDRRCVSDWHSEYNPAQS